MNIIIKGFLFRQFSILSRSFVLKIQHPNLKKLKSMNLNSKIEIALYHSDKIISNFTSRHSLSNKIVGYWLLSCSGMVFVAVTLGGITRLTESGLSIVTWKLLGEKIPLNEVSWLNEFEKYKQFPEFKMINTNITLQEFKQIWLMEYIHRMWGRLIGISFIIPASYFWINNMLKPGMKKNILILGILIGCQGLLGWYMVKSGLENDFMKPSDIPRVSQYRLAAHLGLAIIIYTKFLYTALDHLIPNETNGFNIFKLKSVDKQLKLLKRLKLIAYSSKCLIFFTIISGAFVAGLDAGLIYNTFPKMSNKWIPDDILFLKPLIKNFTENPVTVQFDHRILAISTLFLVTYLAIISKKYKLCGRAATAILAVLISTYMQAFLGIFTLYSYVSTHSATAHQSGSLVLLSTIVWLCHEMKCIKKLPK
ncbi:PREDICTED: cytochrome c oxidase assembly protein COX15 homolog [Ceratosolen solmsi marchali]|uniref:Cytochrome c oxidase assembly protein COX15 homolog n=1 Tax=Ceratosolen solmsi marchali TaxID=326594 RepID=A0AAJ7DTB2_9HYME|nr:PREDICTED: cytochrome c oxidase assembly protein COX15 homolog [Ceratosolen solmsi marchali]